MLLENLDICLLCLTFLCGSILTQSNVRRPPSITRYTQTNVTIFVYESVELTCKAEGTPAVAYSWRRNDVALHLNDSNIKRGSDGDITINHAWISTRDGFYQCFATNKYGTALSKVTQLLGAFLNRFSRTHIVNVTVQEGRPFIIWAAGQNSFPKLESTWETVTSIFDRSPAKFHESQRVVSTSDGDLYGAYALKEDELDGRIYKNSVVIEVTYLEVRSAYTRLTVQLGTVPPPDFPPKITYFSKSQEVGLVGGFIELRCFFSGKPIPEITWSRPRNDIPSGRSNITHYNTRLTISNINEYDEEDYVCTATNNAANQTVSYTHNIRVEAVPIFRRKYDRPRDVNITEGDSVTFNCSAYAKPKAIVVWLQNGEPINVKNPPRRFAFSNNNKSLTIRDVCRDCDDPERNTDLMVIQCNASNVHGYAFAQGYLNVLLRTRVTIRGTRNESVDFLEAKEFFCICHVSSDPSTPATVKWNKTDPQNDLVRDEPPYISVIDGVLIIMVYPNCSSECSKYLGEYTCVGDNGYSNDHAAITLSHQHRSTPDPVPQKEETWEVWKINVVAGTIGLILFLIGIFLGCRSKIRSGTGNRRAKDRRLPNIPSMYERVDYDSLGIPLEATGDTTGPMPRALSMYDRIGYASIDQVLSDMANTSDTNAYNGYESIDETHEGANNTDRPPQDDAARYDDMRYLIPQNPREVNPYLNLDMSDQGSTEVNSHIYLTPMEVNQYLDLVSGYDDPHLDENNKEVNPYMDMGQNELDPYLDMALKKADP